MAMVSQRSKQNVNTHLIIHESRLRVKILNGIFLKVFRTNIQLNCTDEMKNKEIPHCRNTSKI